MLDAGMFRNQKLGGVEFRFPQGGVSDSIDCTHYDYRLSPSALNVVFRRSYNGDNCGGTRPGLKSFAAGDEPAGEGVSHWLWPNGEKILWPDGKEISFTEFGNGIKMPDGGMMLNQHETYNVSASLGAIPSNCDTMTIYRGRVVLAKDNMWYASRIGSYDDFDYGGDSEDPSRAVAGNLALATRKGETVTAVAAVDDKFIVLSTARSFWICSGELTQNLTLLLDNVGIVSKNAWCFDGKLFWFMSYRGLYAMMPGEHPEFMSKHLDRRMSGWKSAVLISDPERNAIHIVGTDNDGNPSDWYYDIDNKAAWPVSYPSSKRPTAGGTVMMGDRNKIVFLCADGKFRYWDENEKTDDGTDIVSALAVGPATHSTGDTETAFLAEVVCELDTDIDNDGKANLSCLKGRTHHESLLKSYSFVDCMLDDTKDESEYSEFCYEEKAGWNHVIRPRIRCNSFVFVLWSKSYSWAMSKITAVHRGCGRVRELTHV